MTLIVLGALLAINVIAFLAFGWDKRLAETHQRRIPERTLLALALFGGALGALIGQQLFRHKTQKQPFRTLLWLCALANVVAAVLWLTPDLRASLFG
ncbi:MAG: DUF1294 domain-containing protein [Caulobacteraceae bacterium]|nr:DUF1294 domain-containing protein [Caulobacteraceae bacterium]